MEKNDNEKKDAIVVKKNGSRKIVAISLTIVLLMAFFLAFTLYKDNIGKLNLLSSENSDLIYELSARDSVINDLMDEFRNIENTLDVIKSKRNLLTNISGESSLSKSAKDAIIHDIQVLNGLIDESKGRIDWLNKKLKESGMKIKQFEKKINEMEIDINEKIANIEVLKGDLVKKDFKLSELDKRIDTLQIQLEKKSEEITKQQNEIDAQREELNQAYYAHGTFKELKNKGLVKKEGGFLFIGRSKNIKEKFAAEKFEKVDISQTKMIPVNSRKAELITKHPEDSFSFVEEEGKIAYLEIKDPNEFWKMSKYLVLETRN